MVTRNFLKKVQTKLQANESVTKSFSLEVLTVILHAIVDTIKEILFTEQKLQLKEFITIEVKTQRAYKLPVNETHVKSGKYKMGDYINMPERKYLAFRAGSKLKVVPQKLNNIAKKKREASNGKEN